MPDHALTGRVRSSIAIAPLTPTRFRETQARAPAVRCRSASNNGSENDDLESSVLNTRAVKCPVNSVSAKRCSRSGLLTISQMPKYGVIGFLCSKRLHHRKIKMTELAPASKSAENLVAELRQLISSARRQAAAAVNMALTLLYWKVGDRIRRDVLGNQRAGTDSRFLPRCRNNWSGSSAAGSMERTLRA